jgi:putative ABC transport system substrate-binding protein
VRRRQLLTFSVAAVVSPLLAVRAQSSRPTIGVLLFDSRAHYPGDHPLIIGLRDAGLIDGQTATIVFREADGHVERLPQLAAELIAANPTILISAGPQPIAALKDATTTIPIVMAIVSDPVTYGFVRSLAHPNGNLTGLSIMNTELSGKRIELLREVAPGTSRVTVFTDPTMGPQGLPETSAAAGSLGIDLQVLPLTSDKIEGGFAAAQLHGAQALLVMPTPFYNLPAIRQQLGALALRDQLPSICEEVSYVRDGCLMSYGPDFAAMWRHSAVYVRKILDGAKPADLPVEQPTKFNLFINLKTAKELGLIVPQSVLQRADEVIE